jgi:hypothetical protein
MWRNQHDFLRALFATACLVACFAITILSWPERARSRLATTSPARAVVVRAAVLTGAELIPATHTRRETR